MKGLDPPKTLYRAQEVRSMCSRSKKYKTMFRNPSMKKNCNVRMENMLPYFIKEK